MGVALTTRAPAPTVDCPGAARRRVPLLAYIRTRHGSAKRIHSRSIEAIPARSRTAPEATLTLASVGLKPQRSIVDKHQRESESMIQASQIKSVAAVRGPASGLPITATQRAGSRFKLHALPFQKTQPDAAGRSAPTPAAGERRQAAKRAGTSAHAVHRWRCTLPLGGVWNAPPCRTPREPPRCVLHLPKRAGTMQQQNCSSARSLSPPLPLRSPPPTPLTPNRPPPQPPPRPPQQQPPPPRAPPEAPR